MARKRYRKRPYSEPHEEFDAERATGGFPARLEAGPGGEPYHVAVSRQTDDTFVCPACGQDIAPRTNHVVAWAAGGLFGEGVAIEERRHWHTSCWGRFGRARG
ncbi:MAG: hypothetical protein JW722_03660 [Demequinaceae bacterium]|nr:hypothetical protein [Demequinaceae bacterium]